MIEGKVNGEKTYTKNEGSGENLLEEYAAITRNMYRVMVESGMIPEMAESLIHGTANHGIKTAKEEEHGEE